MVRVEFDEKKIASTVSKNASIFIRKIALDGFSRLVRQSPVDTGRFKANWSTSIDNMHTETTEETAANIASQSSEIKNYKLGQTMFLHNNLVYAIPLEWGSSLQAPKGWIRNTADLMQRKLNEIKDLI